MSVVVTHILRRQPILNTVSTIVLAAFVSLCLEPLALASQIEKATPVTPPVEQPGDGAAMARTLETVRGKLKTLDGKIVRNERHGEELAELRSLRRDLSDENRATLASFDAIESQLKARHLPPVIVDRHFQTVQIYKTEFDKTLAHLDAIEHAPDYPSRHARTLEAMKYLAEKQAKKPRQKFDPNDLPTKSLQPNRKNLPKRTPAEFRKASLAPNPNIRLAALGDFRFDQLPGASDPAYLTATPEVTLTDAIKAKAQALHYDPVQIHNWVRNNVEWLPTWGATQDADVTLGSQRGNSMDIASLEIALLRASLIPARYVYGTVEVPADKFMNWVGGFTNINAALDYASSGGVPVTGVVSGGTITKVQLEQVWVEAAIDFEPSRGAVNKSADIWVQLDPSYKQYQDLPGLDVVAISGLDPNALAQSFATSGTTNTAEGWVQNLNPAILTSAQTQAQTALTSYIQNNLTNPTVGDVIGGRKIVTTNTTVLPASLPYRKIATGVRYGSLPVGLENAMTFSLGTDPFGEPSNPVTFPWAKLNNHKVTLSFQPATSADEQALAALLPPSPITSISQLPTSIPAYLIHVIPQLAVDGQVVMQGDAMTLGTDLTFFYGITRIKADQSQTYAYDVTAGSYLSIAVVGGSISKSAMLDVQTKLSSTRTILDSGTSADIWALPKERTLGDLFEAGVLGYFGEYLALSSNASHLHQARHNLPMAYGSIGYEPNVQTLFGIPRAITPGGVVVNVKLGFVVQPLDGDATKKFGLSLETGLLSSALEFSVPEQMLSTAIQPAPAISAVKALQLASSQGQRIYHITQSNQAQAISNLHLDSLAIDEITQGLATGKEVIVHTDRVSVPGLIGEGYIIYDPITGAGAYKIAGGQNGGKDFDPFSALSLSLGILGGAADGYSSDITSNTPLYKDLARYRLAQKIELAGKVLGGAGVLTDILSALSDTSLSVSSIVGRISVAIFSYGVGSLVGPAIAATFVSPIVAALIAAAFIATLTLVLMDFMEIYFAFYPRRRTQFG